MIPAQAAGLFPLMSKQQALTEPYHQAGEAAAAFPATFLQGSAGELREKGKIS